jgi:hypothetical protein
VDGPALASCLPSSFSPSPLFEARAIRDEDPGVTLPSKCTRLPAVRGAFSLSLPSSSKMLAGEKGNSAPGMEFELEADCAFNIGCGNGDVSVRTEEVHRGQ